MHNKMEKFITQLRHATHGERRKDSEVYLSIMQLISQPKLDKFQSQCFSKIVRSDVHSFPRSNGDVCA